MHPSPVKHEAEAEEGRHGRSMPFWDHIYELRRRMLLVVGAVALLACAGYFVVPPLVGVVQELAGEELYATAITEGFLTRVKVAVLLGAIGGLPLFAIQILLFVAPAISPRARFGAIATLLVAFGLFVGGTVFAFETVLPISLRFLKSDTFFPAEVGRLISYATFLTFFFQFLLGFGLFSQFPVLLMALLTLGVVTRAYLMRNFKYFVGVIFVVAAIVTPPDVVSQILLAAPMVGLYLLTILAARLFRVG